MKLTQCDACQRPITGDTFVSVRLCQVADGTHPVNTELDYHQGCWQAMLSAGADLATPGRA